jgi:hypothetical protein
MSTIFINPSKGAPTTDATGPSAHLFPQFSGAAASCPPDIFSLLKPVERRLTELDYKNGAKRVSLMINIIHFTKEGYSLSSIARRVGLSVASVCNLRRQYGHLKDYELTPENLATARGDAHRSVQFEADLTARMPEAVKHLQQLYLSTIQGSSDYITRGRRTGSASLALQRFADWEQCPPNLARALRRGSQPRALLNVIRQMNDLVEQQYRGVKHSSLNGTLVHTRELVTVLADGTREPINPGDWWVFDDMSTNFPFWFTGPDGKAYVGRQGLYAYDVCQRWVGCELVGTCRDSYTSAIILRFFRRLFEGLGKPRRGVVLERSVWAATSIQGFRLTHTGEVYEEEVIRPAMSKEDKALIHDGLEAIGIHVHYTHTPRGKEIEGGFAYLQRVFPTFAKDWQNIGHHAGEIEKGAKAMRQAHAGSRHPADLKFLHIDAHADLTEKVMRWINERKQWRESLTRPDGHPIPSDGRGHGEGSIPELPRLAPLTERDRAAFLPARNQVQIKDGKVHVQSDNIHAEFTNPDIFPRLGSGFRLFVKWDPSEPTIGAAIYSRETSSANFAGYQVGEWICMAEMLEPVARFNLSDEACSETDHAHQLKKRFNKTVRTAFRAVGMPALKAATARDGAGNVAEVSDTAQTNSIPEPKLPPPPASREVAPMSDRKKDLLARQAARARELMAET